MGPDITIVTRTVQQQTKRAVHETKSVIRGAFILSTNLEKLEPMYSICYKVIDLYIDQRTNVLAVLLRSVSRTSMKSTP